MYCCLRSISPAIHDIALRDGEPLYIVNDRRQPHAVLDFPSRAQKALKIERLLGLTPAPDRRKLLEIGTGSGGIAHYFAHHPALDFQVSAVDVVDQRLVHDGYDFKLVRDTHLPFPDRHFDIVISNHVIEHVGDSEAKRHYLREMRRVLRPDGIAYLAVPNRWMVVEPHYRLAFLSWVPRGWRTHCLRLRGRGSHYDCEPPTKPQLEAMLAASVMRTIEGRYDWLFRLATAVSESFLDRLGYWNPTLIYRLLRKSP